MLYRWRWPLGVLPAGLALVFCLLPGSAISHPLTIVVGSVLGNPPALPDPLPIRRTLLPAERADTVLATAGRDLFLRLPRSEFEAQVQQAARRQAADRTPPQIVEATYQARWSPGCLIGRGQWRIKNPGSLPGTVILEPLTPAIDNPTWGDGSPASIFRGIPPGRVGINTCLWNASESGGDLNFDWSLRGLDEAEEVRFDLGFPTAPITSFELTLPADRTPMVPAGQGFIQGPFAGKQPREQIWKIGPGIAGRIELAIRQPSTIRNTTPAIFSRSARWLLSANARNGTIETTIDAPRRTPTERKFQLDADLMVHDVVGAGVESWKLQGNELFVRSQDHSGPMKWLFTVSSTAQAGPAGWACPILRLADALPGTDTVEIQCAPDVKIEQWLPGDFRVAATAANHATKVLFTGTLLPPNGDDRPDRKMPTLRYKTAEYEFTTREKMEWQIEPGKNSLVSAIEVRVIRGPLANLGLQLLPGYTPTNITAIPDDPGLTWIAAPGVPNTWIIEPTRAVSGGSTFGLRIEARGSAFPQPGHTEDQTPVPTILPFPKVRPLGASDRHLTMVASTGAGLEARFQSSTPGAEVRDGVFHAEYVQRDGEGDAVVSAILPIVRVGQSVVLKAIDDQGINVLSTFRCKVERSLAAGMMIAVPGTGEPNFSWNGVAAKGKRASLPGIGDRMLLPFVLPPGGHLLGSLLEQHSETTLWFVTFARPSMGENTLTVEYPVKVRQDAKPLDVPLAKVCGGHIDETRVSLDSLLADRFQPPLAPSSNSVVLLPRNGVPASPEPVRRTGWVLSHLQWSNRVDHTGQIHSTLSGHVVEAGGPFLEIQQAGGFGTLESARVGSHEVPLPLGRRTDLIRLPIVSAGESFELRYRVPQAADQRPAFPLRTTEPQLPGVERLETIWQSEGDFLFWPRLGTHASGESSFPQWVLRASVLRATGYSLAFLALTMGWWIWLSPQNRRVELLVFVAILALGLASRIDSPGWSLLLRPMLLVGIVVYAGSVLRRGMAIPRWPASATALVLIAVAQAQAPEPSVVYLVPGTDGGDSIYAPKSLIAKLEAMAKPALPPAVLIRAEYELRHDDDFATVDAVFQIESHGSREQTFDLPLTGIRLERASINGRPAFLDGSKVDRFTIVLQNAGQHILELRFTVPVDSTGSDREVRIGTPDVPCCRVSLATGSRTRQLDVPTRRGGQSLASRESGLQLTADHGGGKTIHVRWRDDSTTDGAKPTLSVREASLWDLGEAECTCTSVFQYRIQNGTLSQLKFAWMCEPWSLARNPSA